MFHLVKTMNSVSGYIQNLYGNASSHLIYTSTFSEFELDVAHTLALKLLKIYMFHISLSVGAMKNFSHLINFLPD